MTTKSLLHSSLLDNQYYTSMLVGNAGYVPPAEDILAEEVLTSTQASVTFSSLDTLAAGYQHLQVRYTARTTHSAEATVLCRFNGDTGNNYSWHILYGNGSSVGSLAYTLSFFGGGRFPGANQTAGIFGAAVMDILDPFETTKNTTARTLAGSTGFNDIRFSLGARYNTEALNSITYSLESGSFATGSRFTLIGLK